MTTAQKIIKYCAIAFAIFLIVSIVSGILGAVSGVSYFLSGKTTVTEMETYPITSSVKELKIDLSAARLRLQTGRTHQIRVHMSAMDCPVVGDYLYGTPHDALPGRFALHACMIRFIHPISGAEILLNSRLPEELQALMN